MKFALESKIYAGYATAVVIMLLIGLAVRKVSVRLEDSIGWADHTRTVLMCLEETNTAVLEMQTGFRAYLIKPEPRFLDAYQDGAAHIANLLRQLRQLTRDNPEQQEHLDQIDSRVAGAQANMQARMDIRRAKDLAAALVPGSDPRTIANTRALIAEMRATEQRLLDARTSQVKFATHRTIQFVTVAGLLTMVLLASGAVFVHRDFAADRKMAVEIRKLNANLSEQNKRLEEANQELEAFSYSVSHDLRAPLRHIDGFASLLRDRAVAGLDDESRGFLEKISRAALRMGRLIDDLLGFSRMGRTNLAATLVNTDALVAEVVREAEAGQEGPRVDWSITPLPDVKADPPMLRQVWANLIGNAVKYTGRTPHPRIAISGAVDPAAGECLFSVRDNGVGFDMKYAGQLFGVFHRLHSDEDFKGTGIGLALVRRIVARHGGRTWAEGRPGEGACFHFSLPMKT